MVKVTVVIPTYNMGQYLEECINSIICQSLKEIEVICVDDGSTDDTEEIISRFQEQHAHIYYKRQMNKGAGAARNVGIACAKGKYIAFIDADDLYPDAGSLEYLYTAAERSGVEICGGSRCICHGDVMTISGVRKELIFLEDGLVKTKDFEGLGGYLQFIYQRDFILRNHLGFPDYRRCQDLPFFVRALSLVDKIYVCRIFSYCYRKEHKITIFDERKAVGYLKGIRDTLKITQACGMDKMYVNLLNDFFGEPSAILYKYIADGSKEMLEVSREIRKYLLPEKLPEGTYRYEKAGLLEEDRIQGYLAEVKDKWDRFFADMRDQKILIFGAGTIGRKVYRIFRDKGMLVEAFTVSDTSQNVAKIDGVMVRRIDDYCSVKDRYFVVIAVYGYLQEEIDFLLEEKGFNKRCQINMEELCLCEEQITH